MKKIATLFLCAIMLLALFPLMFSCNSTDTQTDSNKTSDATKGTQSTENNRENETLYVSDLEKYRLIRPADASDEVIEAGNALIDAILVKFGITLDYRTDNAAEATEYEILLGNCGNREEMAVFYPKIKIKDYGFEISGNKIVIAGGSDSAVVSAVQFFIRNIVKQSGTELSDIFYNESSNFRYNSTYKILNIMLNNIDIAEYTIIYPNDKPFSEDSIAQEIADAIRDACGYVIPVKSDEQNYTSGKEIHIGKTNRDTDFYTTVGINENEFFIGDNTGNFISVLAGSEVGYMYAANILIDKITTTDSTKNVSVSTATPLRESFSDGIISAMSFNVLTTKPDEARIVRVITTITNCMPDVIGFQEVSPYWMSVLIERLGNSYGYVGVGRDGGNKGEYNSIFYKKSDFTVLESGTKWLSATPDVVSKYSQSSLNRILTFAKLQRISDGLVFVHINTHFDHTSAEARTLQTDVLLNFAASFSDCEVILTGDFNFVSSETGYGKITAQDFYDAAKIANKTDSSSTFHSYGSASKIIDFCFVTEKVYPFSYAVIKDKIDGEYPSDHYPIYIEFVISY